MLLSRNDKYHFIKLLNRGGYVVGFNSTDEFDNFTESIIGIPLCEKYRLSKGKSLEKYVYEGKQEFLVIKLLKALLERYDSYLRYDIDEETKVKEYKSNGVLKKTCEEILKRAELYPLTETIENLKDVFSDDYMEKQIDLMQRMQTESPADAIGKAKEFIESCCKRILSERDVTYDEKHINFESLISLTLKETKLSNRTIDKNVAEVEEIQRLLGALGQIVKCVNNLRNTYGTGHGKGPNFCSLSSRHAKLVVISAVAFVVYIWERHKELRNNNNCEGTVQ